jgi:hypothetical protein
LFFKPELPQKTSRARNREEEEERFFKASSSSFKAKICQANEQGYAQTNQKEFGDKA